eukprot:767385-Hanusia_phi.AAC.2
MRVRMRRWGRAVPGDGGADCLSLVRLLCASRSTLTLSLPLPRPLSVCLSVCLLSLAFALSFSSVSAGDREGNIFIDRSVARTSSSAHAVQGPQEVQADPQLPARRRPCCPPRPRQVRRAPSRGKLPLSPLLLPRLHAPPPPAA